MSVRSDKILYISPQNLSPGLPGPKFRLAPGLTTVLRRRSPEILDTGQSLSPSVCEFGESGSEDLELLGDSLSILEKPMRTPRKGRMGAESKI